MQKPISCIEFPPSMFPIISTANSSANTNTKKNAIHDIIVITFLHILYARSFVSYISSALYSLIILLIATGNPAVDIFKNKLYTL